MENESVGTNNKTPFGGIFKWVSLNEYGKIFDSILLLLLLLLLLLSLSLSLSLSLLLSVSSLLLLSLLLLQSLLSLSWLLLLFLGLLVDKSQHQSITSNGNDKEPWYHIAWPCHKVLTHWGRVTHICVSKLTIIGSDYGLSPGRRQAIIWTNAGILLIRPLGTNFSEILIGVQAFSFRKMELKMSSAKWRPFVSASMS